MNLQSLPLEDFADVFTRPAMELGPLGYKDGVDVRSRILELRKKFRYLQLIVTTGKRSGISIYATLDTNSPKEVTVEWFINTKNEPFSIRLPDWLIPERLADAILLNETKFTWAALQMGNYSAPELEVTPVRKKKAERITLRIDAQ